MVWYLPYHTISRHGDPKREAKPRIIFFTHPPFALLLCYCYLCHPSFSHGMLSRLYSANNGILRQKLSLVQTMVNRFGQAEAEAAYRKVCPVVGATMGQHIRHSMDHIERAIDATSHPEASQIHYDLRKRGSLDEHDMVAAQARIAKVSKVLEDITDSDSYIPVMDHRVQACFMLTGDDEKEFALPSTAARELGFAVHHAIHHMAMVRIICLQTLKMPESDLPASLGKAPSTQNYERRHNSVAQ